MDGKPLITASRCSSAVLPFMSACTHDNKLAPTSGSRLAAAALAHLADLHHASIALVALPPAPGALPASEVAVGQSAEGDKGYVAPGVGVHHVLCRPESLSEQDMQLS